MRGTQEARVSRKQARQAGQECVQSYRHQNAHINMHTESVHMHFDTRTLIHAFALPLHVKSKPREHGFKSITS